MRNKQEKAAVEPRKLKIYNEKSGDHRDQGWVVQDIETKKNVSKHETRKEARAARLAREGKEK